MHDLETPRDFAAANPERCYRVGVSIVTLALAAIEIRPRAARWNEYQAQFGIGRHHAPGVCAPGARKRCERIPGPPELPGLRVIRPYDATLDVGCAIISNRRPDNYDSIHHCGRRCDLVIPRIADTQS